MTRAQAIGTAAARLAGTSGTPRLDAELLMAHALGIGREALLLGRMGDPVPAGYEALVERRLAHEPLAYITGMRAFWTIELAVSPAVLIPRPDSETLIEAAVAHFGVRGPRTVLDLGTGSGALLLAALDQWPEATGVGVDRSEDALAVAAGNAERLGLSGRARFRRGDWAEGIAARFDLILCNPPYIETMAALPRDVAEHEPAGALFAGADGLDEYRRLAPEIGRLIETGGIACIEIGANQADAVVALIEEQGLSTEVRQDLAKRDRCIVARR
ncbi:protein-(glutamine-N5) methyltransferase, release factor-specific [Sphingomonas oleivorans]|uniref:Release factor glutamine methyltransferase n=1 Tax=Sphingomonas oleivorans TaxID=1735121 RepID=A0A2T5G2Z1_9SPHN|nr:peptide chain release factor N(5)-glutamine methyltransferase [Sphingomonas oleivorans]PTQ13500.1 protein-(glutamine-N5) methyltransferase, release factor-specific [Sphingomonas oleivorans]